jgi:hypothetical protein
MVAYGKIANRLPQQLLIGMGATLTACTGLLLMGINPGTGTHQLFWPLVVRGLGSVMMFMPLSIATLGPLPKKDIPAGAGFYSLTRQLGSSIGIALITTMLARRMSLHRAILVEKVTDFSQPTIQRLGMLGGSLGHHGGMAGRQGGARRHRPDHKRPGRPPRLLRHLPLRRGPLHRVAAAHPPSRRPAQEARAGPCRGGAEEEAEEAEAEAAVH